MKGNFFFWEGGFVGVVVVCYLVYFCYSCVLLYLRVKDKSMIYLGTITIAPT